MYYFFVEIPKVQCGSYDNCFNSIVEQGICYFIDFSFIIVFRVFLINVNVYFWLNFS